MRADREDHALHDSSLPPHQALLIAGFAGAVGAGAALATRWFAPKPVPRQIVGQVRAAGTTDRLTTSGQTLSLDEKVKELTRDLANHRTRIETMRAEFNAARETLRIGPTRTQFTELSNKVDELGARADLTRAEHEALARAVRALEARTGPTHYEFDELTRRFGELGVSDRREPRGGTAARDALAGPE